MYNIIVSYDILFKETKVKPIDVGILSILPPLIAIILALKTRQVIFSLFLGILSGTLIYVFNIPVEANTNQIAFLHKIVLSFEYIFRIMQDHFDIMMIIFLSVLGALVAVVTLAGGARAYGEWAAKKVKTPVGAKLATSFLGIVIFIDDYFNCLTVGTVMRPITDKHKISREKLAYLIDAMAAPICIIAPISSWAASIITQFPDNIEDKMGLFLQTIPFNFYALLTIIAVLMLSIWNIDFGSMARFDRIARNKEKQENIQMNKLHVEDFTNKEVKENGKVYDLLIPILALIIFSILAMLYTGGMFTEQKSLFQAFGDTEPTISLVLGGLAAIIIALFLFIIRKVLSLTEFMHGIVLGVKAMVEACLILVFAWTIKGVCEVLSTGEYVSHLVQTSNLPVMIIPAIIFIVAGILAFSIGTSWGTFGILIPIMIDVSIHTAPDLLVIILAATLAGSVFGDHCSPISDTTILSATGAGCQAIDHASSQIPYALLVASSAFIGFLIAGFTKNWFLSFTPSIIILIISFVYLGKRNKALYGD